MLNCSAAGVPAAAFLLVRDEVVIWPNASSSDDDESHRSLFLDIAAVSCFCSRAPQTNGKQASNKLCNCGSGEILRYDR